MERVCFRGETYIAIGDTLYIKNPPCWDAVKRFGGKIEGMVALNDMFCVSWRRKFTRRLIT